jgi:hypothetical protein
MAGGGSAPGERRGGRQKGTSNKATPKLKAAGKKAVKRALAGGATPLDIMTLVMRGAAHISDRQFAAAQAAAPYVHARLSAGKVEGDLGFGALLDVMEQRRRKPGGE